MSDLIRPEAIRAAHAKIRSRIRRTPVIHTAPGDLGLDASAILKLELLQFSGSFKVRGAFTNLLSRDIPEAGVTAASGGNHGAAVAFAANRLGLKAQIFVPETAAKTKIDLIRSFGASVHVEGQRYSDAAAFAKGYADHTGALEIHAYDAVETIIGQGTVGIEWQEQALGLDTVIVATGGGGLVAGISSWFEDRVKVVAVEPKGARALYAAVEAGRPVDVKVDSIAADSLGARRTGDIVFDIASQHVDDVLLVEDEDILAAQKRLWWEFRVAAEPGAATALAAVISGAYQPERNERIGILVCGGNVDLQQLESATGEPDALPVLENRTPSAILGLAAAAPVAAFAAETTLEPSEVVDDDTAQPDDVTEPSYLGEPSDDAGDEALLEVSETDTETESVETAEAAGADTLEDELFAVFAEQGLTGSEPADGDESDTIDAVEATNDDDMAEDTAEPDDTPVAEDTTAADDAVTLPDNIADILTTSPEDEEIDDARNDEMGDEMGDDEVGAEADGDESGGSEWDFSESIAAALDVSAFEVEPAADEDVSAESDAALDGETPDETDPDDMTVAETNGDAAAEETEAEQRSSENV